MSTITLRRRHSNSRISESQILEKLGADFSTPERLALSLPFAIGDATSGVENELQVVVKGSRKQVDLPITIEQSNYFKNIIKRHGQGELPRRFISELEHWLDSNKREIWENSWVRLKLGRLTPLANMILEKDFLADKARPDSGRRQDADRFLLVEGGENILRVPVSYMLKLALVDAAGRREDGESLMNEEGLRLADHFLSDNTSPETYSFYVTPLASRENMGKDAAAETAIRYLLTQLLVQYAEKFLGLEESGQDVKVYFSPHPPVRQKELNECISDSFYRELFMNPCLSGWNRGEAKHRYMHLCHEVLSRAQINALSRLKEAGIITSNLVVLPRTSNISLANNGTHLSLGSRIISNARKASVISPENEKYLGDLIIKCVEHFLPLFVGAYSAAPYRIDFKDFHPEKVLSFLPYQLDYTQLRMIWRRWKKKAHLKVRPLGFRLTPFGPPMLDWIIGKVAGLKGDYLPDYRLLDYLVSVMSTEQCPGLDGCPGNEERLKKDLAELGVFDPQMPIYMLYRQRIFHQNGFSGFEGRHYSVFESLNRDLARAAELQCLVTALACRLIASGELVHEHIPDRPDIESERRQIFFGAAIGLPTFFVRQDSGNLFLKEILKKVQGIRVSRRYPGYLRVRLKDYCPALIEFLREKGAPQIEAFGLEETIRDLKLRQENSKDYSAHDRLTSGILDKLGKKSPLSAESGDFNQAAEDYYREDLRLHHMTEAWDVFEQIIRECCGTADDAGRSWVKAVGRLLKGKDVFEYIKQAKEPIMSGRANAEDIIKSINMLILIINYKTSRAEAEDKRSLDTGGCILGKIEAPIHRQAER